MKRDILLVCVLAMLVGAYGGGVCNAGAPSRADGSMTIRIHSGELYTEFTMQSEAWKQALFARAIRSRTSVVPESDTFIELQDHGETATYAVDESFDLYSDRENERIKLAPESRVRLQSLIAGVRDRHFGKPLPWRQAKKMVALKSVFTVVDLETGLRFRVQRRAGRQHADVQTLTKQDTAIMKQVFGGEWTWRRRAVLVRKDGQVIAASMHGRPHGGDGIPDNGLSGHVCIHFLESTTHGSGKVDPDHQLMVHKAAGKLKSVLEKSSPDELVDAFMIALNQRDPSILPLIFNDARHPQLAYFRSSMSTIQSIRPTHAKEDRGEHDYDLITEVTVAVAIHRRGQSAQETIMTFQFQRNSVLDPWKIAYITQISSQTREEG